ncbi:hypothetical protein K3495_g11588 [Podosphaera aphanis]|nr:hypothetical protein K3495_g11588 [Podosphaera aphanis]
MRRIIKIHNHPEEQQTQPDNNLEYSEESRDDSDGSDLPNDLPSEEEVQISDEFDVSSNNLEDPMSYDEILSDMQTGKHQPQTRRYDTRGANARPSRKQMEN